MCCHAPEINKEEKNTLFDVLFILWMVTTFNLRRPPNFQTSSVAHLRNNFSFARCCLLNVGSYLFSVYSLNRKKSKLLWIAWVYKFSKKKYTQQKIYSVKKSTAEMVCPSNGIERIDWSEKNNISAKHKNVRILVFLI